MEAINAFRIDIVVQRKACLRRFAEGIDDGFVFTGRRYHDVAAFAVRQSNGVDRLLHTDVFAVIGT